LLQNILYLLVFFYKTFYKKQTNKILKSILEKKTQKIALKHISPLKFLKFIRKNKYFYARFYLNI